ncbi:MAG: alpha/beta hydrolase [Candidatus Pacebacteria bacterium]|nr:alpha/beta hydrolase [Candidatus Paceibacterota bacterium]
MKWTRTLLMLAPPAFLIATVPVAKHLWDAKYLNAYRPDCEVHYRIVSTELHDGYVKEMFRYRVGDEQSIPVAAAIPKGPGPHPAIVFLYGIGMKMSISKEIAAPVTSFGFALFIPEQYTQGKRKIETPTLLKKGLALRQRAFMTGPEARYLVDTIVRRDDIDPKNIYLWGASFGAMTGCRALAEDNRFRAGILTVAGGDLLRLVRTTRYYNRASPLERVAARMAVWFFDPLDPIKCIDKVAPRAVLLQNVKDDTIIPHSSAQALYAAAHHPKRIVWYEGTHKHAERAVLEQAVKDGLLWLQQQSGTPFSQ